MAKGRKNHQNEDSGDREYIGANGNIARAEKDQLKSFVSRIEKLEEEKKVVANEIKEVFAEAKAHGYDMKALRKVIKERKEDKEEREQFEQICDLYRMVLGLI